MTKVIDNPFEYREYRLLLNDDFLARTSRNHNYSLRAYARDVDLSPGFLSYVMKGKKKIGRDVAGTLFANLGYRGEELEYIEKLVIYECSANDLERQQAFEHIQARFEGVQFEDKVVKDGYMRSFHHFLIYGLIHLSRKVSDVSGLAEELSLSPELVERVLNDLFKDGFLEREENQYRLLDETSNMRFAGEIVPLFKNFSDLIADQVLRRGGIRVPDRIVQVLFLGFDEKNFEQATALHKQFIGQIHRLSMASKVCTKFGFMTNSFLAVPSPTEAKKSLPRPAGREEALPASP